MRGNYLKAMLWSVFAILIFSIDAQASLSYETAYMVKDNNSYTLSLDGVGNYSYQAGELPWLYLKLKFEDLNTDSPLHLHWVWSSDTDPNITETQTQRFSISSLSGDKEIWSSAPEPWWSNIGGPGHWTVDANWVNVGGTTHFTSANFTVTPEPLSSTLFLLGGIPLVGRMIRKKTQSV